MKIAFIAIAALLSVVAAAPPSSGNTKCSVSGFKTNVTNIVSCCLKNTGGSNTSNRKRVDCTLPVGKKASFSKCVKRLGRTIVVKCVKVKPTPPKPKPTPPKPKDMSECKINGFKVDPAKISACCLKNGGGAQAGTPQGCNLNIHSEDKFKRCVKDLGFATTADCVHK